MAGNGAISRETIEAPRAASPASFARKPGPTRREASTTIRCGECSAEAASSIAIRVSSLGATFPETRGSASATSA